MNILSFFTGIWSKVAAVFAAIAGVFFLIIKHQSNKIESLEHENEALETKSKIQEESAVITARAMAAEQDEILKNVEEKRNKSKLDRLNDV